MKKIRVGNTARQVQMKESKQGYRVYVVRVKLLF